MPVSISLKRRIVTDIVINYVAKNPLLPATLPELIKEVYRSIDDKEVSLGSVEPRPRPAKPAVPISKSVGHNFLICLEDGVRRKSLKKHLEVCYGMTPAEYRNRWNLPESYPMVAPSLSQKRSELAKKMGLGAAVTKAKTKLPNQ